MGAQGDDAGPRSADSTVGSRPGGRARGRAEFRFPKRVDLRIGASINSNGDTIRQWRRWHLQESSNEYKRVTAEAE